MERVTCRSTGSGGSWGLGIDWSCDPQFASVIAWILECIGKWTKDWRESLESLWKAIPRDFVPLMYLMMCLAAAIWPYDGLFCCCARRFVATARSGLVPCDSHKSDPTYDWSCCFNSEVSWGGRGVCLIESIGRPDLNGVLFIVADSVDRPASDMRLSQKASCDRCTDRRSGFLPLEF